ncbi:hypothetical protein A2U01_0070674, partial [Trifolium medium]|nr:hypothetical protein [Trifolium medium]
MHEPDKDERDIVAGVSRTKTNRHCRRHRIKRLSAGDVPD